MILIVAWVVVAGVLGLVLHRHLQRLEARREFARQYAAISESYARMQVQIAERLAPALSAIAVSAAKAAKSLEEFGRAMSEQVDP